MARNNRGLGFGPDRLRHIVGRIVGRIVFAASSGRIVGRIFIWRLPGTRRGDLRRPWAGPEHEPTSGIRPNGSNRGLASRVVPIWTGRALMPAR
jgi:hypothetical protein